jgi:hypothetical protein
MNMKPNLENPKGWTLPAELPSAFALPKEFRESLPDEVQQWLNSVERRIDGLPLDRIEKEAEELAGEDSPEAERLYRLGRRLFYTRLQQICDLMFPGQGIEFGVDLLWEQTIRTLPGGAITNALCDGENINGCCLSRLEKAGFEVG